MSMSKSGNTLLERNIAALLQRRAEEDRTLGWQERLAAWISSMAGTMAFVWFHLLLFSAWILINLGIAPGLSPFDRSLVVLAMVASVEAIFISTFILITQNRMQRQADRRADLNLQISLLAEHEIIRLVQIVSEIGERIGAPSARSADLEELKRDVRPETVLEKIEQQDAPIAVERNK